MNKEYTSRGFELVTAVPYGPEHAAKEPSRVVQQSSAIGDYPDAADRPGSSALWLGDHHHLDREQVAELRDMLTAWLETGQLFAAAVPAS